MNRFAVALELVNWGYKPHYWIEWIDAWECEEAEAKAQAAYPQAKVLCSDWDHIALARKG